jgi:hypothetical protein
MNVGQYTIHMYYVVTKRQNDTAVLVHNCPQIIAGRNLGVLSVTAKNAFAAEMRGTQEMAARGHNVMFRDPSSWNTCRWRNQRLVGLMESRLLTTRKSVGPQWESMLIFAHRGCILSPQAFACCRQVNRATPGRFHDPRCGESVAWKSALWGQPRNLQRRIGRGCCRRRRWGSQRP